MLEADLRDLALVMTRTATDTGARTDLDKVISSFGFDRAELEAELRNDLAGGRGDTRGEQADAPYATGRCGDR